MGIFKIFKQTQLKIEFISIFLSAASLIAQIKVFTKNWIFLQNNNKNFKKWKKVNF